MIVPYPAGGLTDTFARIIAERMREPLGQRIIIENVGGADGSIGVGRAARARPEHWVVYAKPPFAGPEGGARLSVALPPDRARHLHGGSPTALCTIGGEGDIFPVAAKAKRSPLYG